MEGRRLSSQPGWRTKLALGVGVTLLACVTMLRDLGSPAAPIWDEAYYLTSAARYREGRVQFASHPPLGLMLIAAGQELSGLNRGLDLHPLARVKSAGAELVPKGYDFAGVRLASALFGVLVVLSAYLLVLAATAEPFGAAGAAAMLAFETAFAAQFRAAHLDSFQVAFGLVALGGSLGMQRTRGTAQIAWSCVAGAGVGAAGMVKADGLLLAVAPALAVMPMLLRGWRRPATWIAAAICGGTSAAACLSVVVLVFLAHVESGRKTLDYGAPAAAKDARYVSPAYQQFLERGRALSPRVLLAAAVDYGRFMAADLKGMARSDPNGSPPLLQPLGSKPINYRWDSDGRTTSYVQLVPNPVNWAASLASIIASLVVIAIAIRRPSIGAKGRAVVLAGALIVWLVMTVVHAWLGSGRVMYLYHHFIGLVVGILTIPLIVEAMSSIDSRFARRRGVVTAGLVAASACAFVWWSPLAYHRPLSHAACFARTIPLPMVACR